LGLDSSGTPFREGCGVYEQSLRRIFSESESLFFSKRRRRGTICQVTVITDRRQDGTPCETVICQASCPFHLANDELIDEMIYDVAFGADLIENTYFFSF